MVREGRGLEVGVPDEKDSPQDLHQVLSRVVTGPRWYGHRARPATAALAGVVVLSVLGITAPWADQTAAPVPGHSLPASMGPSTAVAASQQSRPPDPPGHAQPGDSSPTPEAPAAGAGGGDGGDGGDGDPAPPPPAPPPAPAVPRLTSLGLSVGGGLTATLYVGQLDEVIRRLDGKVTFNTDPAFRSAYPGMCVTTVVVEGVSGREGAVFAHGLGSGWGGAENVPDQRVAADNGTLHQQLVIPPSNAGAGQRWTGSVTVRVDGSQVAQSGDYRLILDRKDGSHWQLRVVDNGVTVDCRRY